MLLSDQHLWKHDTPSIICLPDRSAIPITHLQIGGAAELGQLLVLLELLLLRLPRLRLRLLVVLVLDGCRGVLGGLRGSRHRRHGLQARLGRHGGGLCDGRGCGGGGWPLLEPFVLHALGGCHPGAGENGNPETVWVSNQTLIRGGPGTPTSGPWPATWL